MKYKLISCLLTMILSTGSFLVTATEMQTVPEKAGTMATEAARPAVTEAAEAAEPEEATGVTETDVSEGTEPEPSGEPEPSEEPGGTGQESAGEAEAEAPGADGGQETEVLPDEEPTEQPAQKPVDTDTDDTDVKDTDTKDTDVKDTETKDTETKDTAGKETGTKDTETKDADTKDTSTKETDTKGTNSKDTDSNTETKGSDTKAPPEETTSASTGGNVSEERPQDTSAGGNAAEEKQQDASGTGVQTPAAPPVSGEKREESPKQEETQPEAVIKEGTAPETNHTTGGNRHESVPEAPTQTPEAPIQTPDAWWEAAREAENAAAREEPQAGPYVGSRESDTSPGDRSVVDGAGIQEEDGGIDGQASDEEEAAKEPMVHVANVINLQSQSRAVQPQIYIEQPEDGKAPPKLVLIDGSGRRTEISEYYVDEDQNIRYKMPVLDEDGRYTIQILGEDGKPIADPVIFSVNRKGTVFTYESKKESGDNRRFTPAVEIDNMDITEVVSCMVNGREVPYVTTAFGIEIPEAYLQEGKNTVVIVTHDEAGNVSVMDPWEFEIAGKRDGILTKSASKRASVPPGWQWFAKRIVELFTVILPDMQ